MYCVLVLDLVIATALDYNACMFFSGAKKCFLVLIDCNFGVLLIRNVIMYIQDVLG